jgi:hypothetical protein
MSRTPVPAALFVVLVSYLSSGSYGILNLRGEGGGQKLFFYMTRSLLFDVD